MMWTKQDMPDLTGKTAIVTGANTGIGYETAKALYEAGAQVIIACRDIGKGNKAVAAIQTGGGKGKLEVLEVDLADLHSITTFVAHFTAAHQQLDILINNAGVMIPPLGKTTEGFELQFGVNFIGHFALTGRLYPLLKVRPGSRVVTVSSMAYLRGKIDFDNLKAEKAYDPMREYAQSKLADILFARELQRRIEVKGDSVLSTAAQPGANKTELSRYMSDEDYQSALARFGELMEPWQGALPSLYAATAADVKAATLYSPDEPGGFRGYPALDTLAPHALDEQVGAKLFALAEEVTGVYFP